MKTATHHHDSQACPWCQSGNYSHSPMSEYPDSHVYLSKERVPWVQLCKRTEDPKLTWLEQQLTAKGIPSRRNGHSFHGPILEVRKWDEEKAWAVLYLVDDIEDDAPQFQAGVEA
jgi:hypothetical protein